MRMKIYQRLVNRHIGIGQRYHKVHDNAGIIGTFFSWIYLLMLNFAYIFLFCKFLDKPMGAPIYEEKRLKVGKTESQKILSEEVMITELQKYDVISFDIFDTLIYRPFSNPTDLFYLVGIELEYMDFVRVRTEAEQCVRWKKFKQKNSFEVSLCEIWDEVSRRTGINRNKGMEIEIRFEKEFCFANPYLLNIYSQLKKIGKKIIYISDMYLPKEVLYEILNDNGYDRDELFLSCDLNINKGSGELFSYVKKTLGDDISYVHIGDNKNSDVKRAKRGGFSTYPVINPNKYSVLNRAHDMSPIIGGAYRGVVNNRIYNGFKAYDKYFEYGYIYGGLFVLGYCNFIHEYRVKNEIDKILFLARDGEIIKAIYDKLYPNEDTVYVYSSRTATCKLMAGYDRNDFIKKMVYHKINRGYTFDKILKAMELESLISLMKDNKEISENEKLTNNNVDLFIGFLDKHWEQILEIYRPQRAAAGKYFEKIIEAGDKIGVVDIGWAGTGAIAIRVLARNEWKIDSDITSIVAGTNTYFNFEPYMSEGFLQNGTMVSYLYSSSYNRDIWKKHNPGKGYNLFFELLTSSNTPSFKGFYKDENNEGYRLEFLNKEKNTEGILEIQEGINTFVDDYLKHFGKYEYMLHISGRDAYAPMIVATSHKEKYINALYKDFELKMEVGI